MSEGLTIDSPSNGQKSGALPAVNGQSIQNKDTNCTAAFSMESMSALTNAYNILKVRYNNLKLQNVSLTKKLNYHKKMQKSSGNEPLTHITESNKSEKSDLNRITCASCFENVSNTSDLIQRLEKTVDWLDGQAESCTDNEDLKELSSLFCEAVIPKLKRIETKMSTVDKTQKSYIQAEESSTDENPSSDLCKNLDLQENTNISNPDSSEPCLEAEKFDNENLDSDARTDTTDPISLGFDETLVGEDLTELAGLTLQQNRDLKNVCQSLKRQNEFLKTLYSKELERRITLEREIHLAAPLSTVSSDWSLLQNSQ